MLKFFTPVLLITLTMIASEVIAQQTDADEKSSQEAIQSEVTQELVQDEPLVLADPSALAEYLQSKIQGYFWDIEAITKNLDLKKAISSNKQRQLSLLAEKFHQQLSGSLKVRLYPTGADALDFTNIPACGFTCVHMIQSADKEPPVAEALLYKTPEANITLVRSITNGEGKAIGAIVVHYPYSLLGEAIKAMQNIGLYSEFRQAGTGKSPILFSHGDKDVKQGPVQSFIRIANTSWSIGIWTPGGVAIETYEPPSLPWMQIIVGAIILVVGLVILMVYRIKRPRKPAARKVPKSRLEDAAFLTPGAMTDRHENEDGESTLVLAGGAAEVDVSAYLKKEDITDIKKRLHTDDIADIKKKHK